MLSRSRLLATLLPTLLLLTALTGCMEEPAPAEPSLGQSERTETIRALNLALITREDGVARLVGTLINDAEPPDRLVGLDIDTEIGDFDVVIADAPIELVTDEPVELAREAEVTVLSPRLRQGFRVEMTLHFVESAPITTTVPVEPPTGAYSEVEIMRPPDGDITPER